jgi:meiotic recombination protein SPO11
MSPELTDHRDIYYRHPDLFMKQSVVDRYIDDLACTFGISRSQLNVVRRCLCFIYARANAMGQTAAAKGLVAGNFKILHEDGYKVDGLKDKQVTRLPSRG